MPFTDADVNAVLSKLVDPNTGKDFAASRSVKSAKVSDGAVAVEIEDTGPGIPAALQERIFHPLVSGREGGSGLGLTLAQNFVNQHHGIVHFESTPGGTVFTVLLPVDEPEA